MLSVQAVGNVIYVSNGIDFVTITVAHGHADILDSGGVSLGTAYGPKELYDD